MHAHSPHRLAGLDALRGLAIASVLLYHLPGTPETWPRLIQPIATGGWVGVDIFFVLSGFLIGGLLIRDSAAHATRRFLLRRALRLYPSFYLFVAALWIAHWWTGTIGPTGQWISELLFMQSYIPSVNGPSWSLAIEEHFYLAAAGIVAALRALRASPILLVPIGLSIFAIDIALRAVYFSTYGIGANQSHLRFGGLFLGLTIAAIAADRGHANFRREIIMHRWPLRSAVCLIGLSVWSPLRTTPWLYIYGLAAIAAGAGACVCLSLTWQTPPRWLMALGRGSYSIYLWHGLIYWSLVPAPKAGTFSWTLALTLVTLSTVIGLVMARLIEHPAAAWRDLRFPASAVALTMFN